MDPSENMSDFPLPGQTLAHYRIESKLGEGGMGVVYKARDTNLDRFVALKVLPSKRLADPERKRRFVQEAKAASALNHPNFVTVHDATSDAGLDFIVMASKHHRASRTRMGNGKFRAAVLVFQLGGTRGAKSWDQD